MLYNAGTVIDMMVPVAIELEKSVSRASKTEELICKSTSPSQEKENEKEKEKEIKKKKKKI